LFVSIQMVSILFIIYFYVACLCSMPCLPLACCIVKGEGKGRDVWLLLAVPEEKGERCYQRGYHKISEQGRWGGWRAIVQSCYSLWI
jgi:hypothetical protein